MGWTNLTRRCWGYYHFDSDIEIGSETALIWREGAFDLMS